MIPTFTQKYGPVVTLELTLDELEALTALANIAELDRWRGGTAFSIPIERLEAIQYQIRATRTQALVLNLSTKQTQHYQIPGGN